MIVVLLTLGLEGAVLTSSLVAAVGWLATAHGHGPIWLMRSATQEDRLIVLQIFIWMCAATALPVGALLDERRRAERVGDENKAIYETLLNNAGDVIILSSLSGAQRYVSPAIEQLTGWTAEEFLALDRLKTFHPEDVGVAGMILGSLASGKREHTMRYRMLRKDGSWCWVEAIVRGYGTADDKEVAGYVGTLRDISGRKEEEETWKAERVKLNLERQRLAGLVVIDPLTQVLNRRGFDEALLKVSQKRMGTMCLLMIDVDCFKLYNDTYGHQAGDACLAALANAFLRAVTRDGDVVARLGGEEFAVMLPETDVAGGRMLAEKILKMVRGLEMKHDASPLRRVTVSIGLTFWDHHVRLDQMLLMQEADRALYSSKQGGKDRVTLYESSSRVARIG
jgi:diguanylate cyclase (GGDEF)-like protein/PAS domain S-box-containing protein